MPSVDDDLSGEDESNYEPSPVQTDGRRTSAIDNMPYDEAMELSQDSLDSRAEEKSDGGGKSGRGAKGSDRRLESKGPGGERGGEKLDNNLFDEACDLDDDDESVDTQEGLARRKAQQAMDAKQSAPQHLQAGGRSQPTAVAATPAARPPAPSKMARSPDDASSDESDEEEESATGGGGGGGGTTKIEGAYNPKDYENLNVTEHEKDLFDYIGRYNAHEVELDTTLKCFIPDYIPAVGEMDAFIKVPRPDGERDELGLTVLDEPAAAQSDATVLELQLRAVSKKQHGDVAVRSIENAAKNPLEIDRWINSIADLHRAKPPPQVNYRKAMPDIDKLMEEWPPEFEELLRTVSLPGADIEATLPEFVRLACGIMDVPVYDNLVESLHVLFSLYLEFSENVHFGGAAGQQPQPQ